MISTLELLQRIDLPGARSAGSVLPSVHPRFALMGRLMLKKGWARTAGGKWFATATGRKAYQDAGHRFLPHVGAPTLIDTHGRKE